MNTSRRSFLGNSAALGVGLWAGSLRAQDAWPSKTLRVISPGSAGGGSDIFVRLVEKHFTNSLGQALYIENKPGAGGMTAARVATTAAPDGYTLFVSNLATNAIGPALYQEPTFDARKDLPPVGRIATMSNAVAVRSNAGINSIGELIAYLKAHPDKAFVGSAGVGTSSHLGAVAFGDRIGVKVNHVPYKGTAANLNALLAGEILFSMDNMPLYTQHVQAGTLKLLAVTRAERLAAYPDLPTLKESGVPDFDIFSWYGLSTATGTPPAIIDKLGAALVAAVNDPEVSRNILNVGAQPAALGPAAYRQFINEELDKWAPIVKASGAQVT